MNTYTELHKNPINGLVTGTLVPVTKPLPINRFNDTFSSYIYTLLFSGMNYVYEACNSTILNLSMGYEKISLGLLNYRPKSTIYVDVWVCTLYVYFLLPESVSWLLFTFYLVGCKMGLVGTRVLNICREIGGYYLLLCTFVLTCFY